MSGKFSLVLRKNGVLTRSYIERVNEQILRAQLAVLNGIDADSITEAMKAQCRLAAKGDRQALQFVLSMIGAVGSQDFPGRRALDMEEVHGELPPFSEEDDEGDGDD